MFRRYPLSGPFLLIFAILLPSSAAAELLPAFSLTPCTGAARAIVRGQLDKAGRLTVTELYRGSLDRQKTILLQDGAGLYSGLNRVSKQAGPLEVIAFLATRGDRGWALVRGRAGVVRLGRDEVYAYVSLDFGFRPGGTGFVKHPDYTRASLLDAVRAAVRTEKERERLLALPPAAGRVGKLVTLLLRLDPGSRAYHLAQVCRALRPVRSAEEKELVAALKAATDPGDRVLLLDMMGGLPLSRASFEAVAPWTGRKQQGPVRQSAMNALARIDPYRAAGHLATLLSLNEPEVPTLLACLWPAEDAYPRNRKAVEALALFACGVRQAQATEGPDSRHAGTQSLVSLLAGHGHPRLIPVLYEWALADNHPSCDQALSELCTLTGLKFSRSQRNEWLAWWRKAGPVLEARYDLASAAGRQVWLKAAQAADAATRPLLIRLWLYEPSIDEAALLEAASGKYASPAKATLAELWARKILSPSSRQAIVKKFLAVELVEQPAIDPNDLARRELRIAIQRNFPFPAQTWVQPRSDIAVGRPPRLAGSWGALSLGDAHTYLGSMGGSYRGAPDVRALLELREVDHANGARVLWTARWALGPVRLRKVP